MQCIGAKVNGKMVPLSYELSSGDQVEIITSKKQTPNPDWINFVTTHKARSRIRHWANEKRRKTVELGREIWRKKAERAHVEISDHDLQEYITEFKFPDIQQLFYEIGSGLFEADDLVQYIKKGSSADGVPEGVDGEMDEAALREKFERFLDTAQATGQQTLLVEGELQTDLAVNYAACCNPVPGDDVFGFVSKTGTINIHRSNCRNASDLLTSHPDRILKVEWSRQKDVQFVAALRLVGEDRVGMVNDISTVISKVLKTNIRSITIDSEDGIFSGTVVLYVNDREHLRSLIERLKRIDGIHGVYRFEE
jgi:GTP pyrophosphokinase/guanosine-3',5'-bis(diphosphate) 3'-pyrophosphohydrolase